ncbi:cruciform cutting endonuclease [Yamadazyma tenuis]|uniref:Ribonuclease H-like protein n=1 Tax=Candida tenuis (strain ATCC 10573 / BCRC 21748 / CBS 615 / JCM 9827 / NBRC 10315 / NRRL Y-1498 / VKM Y-70) TaxID=590646 RepID=G3BCV2_CANTC|nr:ribonuclease H-like protein [Yamadazyma tenuis ATCC 10573]EGV60215.1 ribonuclease H-like protein [Yamadazyma tenuis ATCC 10573]WEJ94543.1 cruciform cutting endonuclease [Yamadazyma tenuis]
MNRLLQHKAETLNQLSVLCGVPIRSTKVEKARSLLHTINFYLRLPPTLDLVAIDIGIKNFSYCKITAFDVATFSPTSLPLKVSFNSWKTINLTEKYPPNGDFDKFNRYGSFDYNDLLHDKYYLSYLNYRVFQELFTPNQHHLNVVLIETQRTKSNNNKVTLPNILGNYHFENLFYAQMLRTTLESKQPLESLLLPMNSNKMTSFTINRFLDKVHINSANSKKLRLRFFIHLVNKGILQLDSSLSLPTDSRKLLAFYNSREPIKIKKLDDLFDSFLYNFNFMYNYSNSVCLHHYLQKEKDLDELVHLLNYDQLTNLHDLFTNENYSLNSSFADFHEGVSRPTFDIDRTLWELEPLVNDIE